MDASNVENRFSMGALVAGEGVKYIGKSEDNSASIKMAKWNERSIKWTVPQGVEGAGRTINLSRDDAIHFLNANMTPNELDGKLSEFPFFGPSSSELKELLTKYFEKSSQVAKCDITQLSSQGRGDKFKEMTDTDVEKVGGKVLARSGSSGGPMVVLDKDGKSLYISKQARQSGNANHGMTQTDWNNMLDKATGELAKLGHKPHSVYEFKIPTASSKMAADHAAKNQIGHVVHWQDRMKGKLEQQQWNPSAQSTEHREERPITEQRQVNTVRNERPAQNVRAQGGDVNPVGLIESAWLTIKAIGSCLAFMG